MYSPLAPVCMPRLGLSMTTCTARSRSPSRRARLHLRHRLSLRGDMTRLAQPVKHLWTLLKPLGPALAVCSPALVQFLLDVAGEHGHQMKRLPVEHPNRHGGRGSSAQRAQAVLEVGGATNLHPA